MYYPFFIIKIFKEMQNNNFKYVNNEMDSLQDQHRDQYKNEVQNVKMLSKEKRQTNNQSTSKKVGSDSNSNARAKLIDQHSKLKGQLKELAAKMDEIVQKQKQRKKKKNAINPADENQRVAQLKKQLAQQELRIQKNKAEINRLRRNLDNKYDINKIVEKQNELKHLKKQLQNLEQEKESLERIRKTQDKAIKSGEDKETAQKISKMQQELRELTQKTKKQIQAINQKQKQIRRLHEAYIVKQQKVKEIQAKAKEKKASGEQINEYTIAQLQQEIKNLEKQRMDVEKEGNQKVRGLERQRKQLKQELQRKKLILDEKEKELRLNQMKQKQIVRLINSNPQGNEQAPKEDKEKKPEAKRVVAKRGRQAPKIQDRDDLIDDN